MPNAHRAVVALLMAAGLSGPTGAIAATAEFTLDNGLKLIVHEDHRAPVAVVQVWYRVGSSHEHDGITGVSHALEHMMFKGTPALGPGEFSRIVADNGGDENAFTSTDYTAYYQQWGADNVELSFRLESDRMQNLLLDVDEFGREIKVVREERRLRTDDNPQAQAYEATMATAFQTSPYRHPIIGWAADIENMSADDLRAWYKRWYAPNNAIVVVAGDVEPNAVLALARQYFGPIAAVPMQPVKPRPETPQQGQKQIQVESTTARLPFVMLGYKVPVLPMVASGETPEWEIFALDVLAATLDGDESSRLTRELVRGRELAVSAGASYDGASRLESLFSLSAVPRPGVELDELAAVLRAEVDKLVATPPSEQELDRIKTQVVADMLYQRDSVFYQAMLIGSLEAIGLSWRMRDEYVEKIRAITPAQVQAVAKKYLTDKRETVTYLVPVEGES